MVTCTECIGSMIDLEASAASWHAFFFFIRFANPSQKWSVVHADHCSSHISIDPTQWICFEH